MGGASTPPWPARRSPRSPPPNHTIAATRSAARVPPSSARPPGGVEGPEDPQETRAKAAAAMTVASATNAIRGATDLSATATAQSTTPRSGTPWTEVRRIAEPFAQPGRIRSAYSPSWCVRYEVDEHNALRTKKPGSATPASRLHVLLGRDAPRCAYCFSAPPGATRPEQVPPAWEPERVPPARRSAVTRGRRTRWASRVRPSRRL